MGRMVADSHTFRHFSRNFIHLVPTAIVSSVPTIGVVEVNISLGKGLSRSGTALFDSNEYRNISDFYGQTLRDSYILAIVSSL